MTERPDPASRLHEAFEQVSRTRMAGLPFVNAALRVEVVGMRDWEGHWLCVLVTPWSMNLVLLPGGAAWPALPDGGERFVALPAGRFRFIANRDPLCGEYHACSLFSPVLQFADHESARATAEAALMALFDAANAPTPAQYAAGTAIEAPAADAVTPSRAPAPLSKRDFLRGRFAGTDHVDRG